MGCVRFICICRLLYRTAGAANNQNVHEHNQRATTGALECARLLALLGGLCGFRLLRAAELSGGESVRRSRIDVGRCRGSTTAKCRERERTFFARFFRSLRSFRDGFSTLGASPDYKNAYFVSHYYSAYAGCSI